MNSVVYMYIQYCAVLHKHRENAHVVAHRNIFCCRRVRGCALIPTALQMENCRRSYAIEASSDPHTSSSDGKRADMERDLLAVSETHTRYIKCAEEKKEYMCRPAMMPPGKKKSTLYMNHGTSSRRYDKNDPHVSWRFGSSGGTAATDESLQHAGAEHP